MAKASLKQAIVGSPVEGVVRRMRWLAQWPQRHRHPELWDLYLEESRITVALAALLQPGSNCVDVGAHIGTVLAEMIRLAPEGTHRAFEPVPTKVRSLRKRFPAVEVIEAATSDTAGTARFYHDLDRPGFSGLRKPVDPTSLNTYDVDVVVLDEQLADAERIDFLKIDVEGAELPSLRGAGGLLERYRPAILFECGTDPQLQRFGYKRSDLFGFLVERGYDVYSIVDFVFGREPMTGPSFDKAGTYPYRGFNYLALPAGTEVRRLL